MIRQAPIVQAKMIFAAGYWMAHFGVAAGVDVVLMQGRDANFAKSTFESRRSGGAMAAFLPQAFSRDAPRQEQPQHKELIGRAALRSQLHEAPKIGEDHLANRPLAPFQVKTVAFKQ
ncbi:hypothetical protein B1812_01155 [Methylocystis bryophila]|uniref:Uncharacterized protein n=1 Tax=Methylocystis bryophila TaxID=655015 RepID=A0A1W6MQZ0_9HYPH|nr:hypothetical protein B1812_01155 [Methylocystis bryophila]